MAERPEVGGRPFGGARDRGSGGRVPRRRARAANACPRCVSRAVPRVVACCGAMVTVAGLERMVFEVLSVLRERGARCTAS